MPKTSKKTSNTQEKLSNEPHTASLSLDTLAKEMREGMPEVQPYVTSAQNVEPQADATPPAPPAATPAVPLSDKKDRYRRPFNPDLHETNPDGTPKLTRNGNLQIKGDRMPSANRLAAHAIKPKATPLTPDEQAKKAQAAAEIEAAKKAQAAKEMALQTKNCAFISVLSFTGVAQGVFGEEWAASEPEMDTMVDATTKYFEANGVTDITPGWALVLATVGYALPRLTMPKTQAKIMGWVDGVTGNKPAKKMAVVKNIPSREEFEAASEATPPPPENAPVAAIASSGAAWLGNGEL